MTFPPPGLGEDRVIAWRLDQERFAPTWDSGEGAFLVGGRWNSRGLRAVYCSLDPATAILEVAVHKGFRALDVVPHVFTAAEILGRREIHVVRPDMLPEPGWLTPGLPRPQQQAYGDGLLRQHGAVAIPSAVSPNSWNIIFLAGGSDTRYAVLQQERFVLDPRLHSGAP